MSIVPQDQANAHFVTLQRVKLITLLCLSPFQRRTSLRICFPSCVPPVILIFGIRQYIFGEYDMIRTLFSAAAVTFSLCGTVQAATIFTDDFDADPLALNASPINWDVTGGTVDVIGGNPTGYFDFYPGNGNYLDMNGSTGAEGVIQTKGILGLVSGKEYALSFSYGTNSSPGAFPVKLTFGLGSLLQTLQILAQPGTLQLVTYTFVYDGSGDFISFADTSGSPGDNGGPVLDNVLLSAVPLPGAGLMLLAGLAGLAGLRRRKALV
jgi:hypothetical protein